jgi:DDE superfamily endonuclease
MVLSWTGLGEDTMSVAVWSGSLVAWERELAALKERIGPVFGRAEVRATAGAFLDGLLSGVARKTGWLLAEQAGLERPYRMQSLLGRSRWDADGLRDRVRADVIEALGDRDGVLVVDETGFIKKGEHSVGVARQYSGTAGRIENCQIGVFLAYASRYGQALIDRRLYLPDAWAQDESKRAKAGVPQEITFATKPEIARDLIAAALDAGAPLCLGAGGRAVWVGLAAAAHAGEAGAALRARGALQPLPALLDRGGAGGDRPRSDGRCPGKRGLGPARRRRGVEGAAAVRLGAPPAVFDRQPGL